jgi:hypothetical protein
LTRADRTTDIQGWIDRLSTGDKFAHASLLD